jgi:DNA-binding transcriptional regulator YbjK
MRNPARRVALLDAAVEVLARDGARGLTFRAVDQEARVPAGTATNYFADRDQLLSQVGEQIHRRLAPAADAVAERMSAPPTQALDVQLMGDLIDRVAADRAGYLALLELRLEATRRPALRDMLSITVRRELAESVRFHLEAGLPGDHTTALVLHLAMSGLIVEHLTLPDVLGPASIHEVAAAIVSRVVPSR